MLDTTRATTLKSSLLGSHPFQGGSWFCCRKWFLKRYRRNFIFEGHMWNVKSLDKISEVAFGLWKEWITIYYYLFLVGRKNDLNVMPCISRRIYKSRGGGRCYENSTAPPCTGYDVSQFALFSPFVVGSSMSLKKEFFELCKFDLNFDIFRHICSWVEMMAPVFSRAAWRCVWHMIQVLTRSTSLQRLFFAVFWKKKGLIFQFCNFDGFQTYGPNQNYLWKLNE